VNLCARGAIWQSIVSGRSGSWFGAVVCYCDCDRRHDWHGGFSGYQRHGPGCGSATLVFVAWIVGGLLCSAALFCYAELGAAFLKRAGLTFI